MAALLHQRCFHHSLREAVARCPECRQFYCRECITEHDDRVICAACLRKLTLQVVAKPSSVTGLAPLVQATLGLAIVFLFFYFVGTALLSIPSQYHEGTVWIDKWWNGR